jgi:biopolymer transport protein ExbB
MVRSAVTAVSILLAGMAMAQDGDIPPVVATEAPLLGEPSAEAEATPRLPGVSVAPAGADHANAAVPSTQAGAMVETDIVSLIRKAHWVVQAVIGLLALAVAAVLTVLLFKVVEFAIAFARLRRAQIALGAAEGLVALSGDCPLAQATRAGKTEFDSLPVALTADLRVSACDRLELALDRIEARAVVRLRSGTGLLASIGAVGPFVGLFGTVFGIMNSFLAIAATKTTNLAVVAPGIAEALLATGVGLVAAIPAVLLYNAILRRIALFRHELADGRADLMARFSRALDQRLGQ